MKNNARLPEKIILIALAGIWGLVCLFPVWHVFSATFSTNDSNMTQTIFPNSISNGISKIITALNTVNMAKATVDTLSYTLLTIVGMLVICSLAAYEFTFFKFPMKKFLFGLVMGSMMLPFVLYVIPLYRFVFSIGLSDTLWGVALPLMVSPLSVFIMMQFCEDLPMSFIEAAQIDGAGHFLIFRRIVFPLMRNGLITATVLMFLHSWGAFLWPALVAGSEVLPVSKTISNMLSPNFYVDARVKMGAMLIAMVPPLIIYLVFQRYVIQGMAMSGVKG